MHAVQDIEQRLQHKIDRGFDIYNKRRWMAPVIDETKFKVDRKKKIGFQKNQKILSTNKIKASKSLAIT